MKWVPVLKRFFFSFIYIFSINQIKRKKKKSFFVWFVTWYFQLTVNQIILTFKYFEFLIKRSVQNWNQFSLGHVMEKSFPDSRSLSLVCENNFFCFNYDKYRLFIFDGISVKFSSSCHFKTQSSFDWAKMSFLLKSLWILFD